MWLLSEEDKVNFSICIIGDAGVETARSKALRFQRQMLQKGKMHQTVEHIRLGEELSIIIK